MALARPFSSVQLLSPFQDETLPALEVTAAQQRRSALLAPPFKPSSLLEKKRAWVQKFQTRKKALERGIRLDNFAKGKRKSLPNLAISAISSAAPLVSDGDESWDEEKGTNPPENVPRRIKKTSKERKKRLIAGVEQTTLDPCLFADPDSRFAEYYGVQIHHKIARPAPEKIAALDSSLDLEKHEKVRLHFPAILLHGFGASLFSWERVMPKLAEILGAPVLAFDRPAFGFTSRPFSQESQQQQTAKKFSGSVYSVAFSAAVTVAFVNFLQYSEQAILIGHSAGSLVAVEAYFQCPEKVAAMVLVAPALMAPLVIQRNENIKKSKNSPSAHEGEMKCGENDSLARVRAALLWTWMKFRSLLRIVWRFFHLTFNTLLKVVFRSPLAIWLVRRIMDKGGPLAVRYAFYDVSKADKYVLDGYTKPLQCRDWERALLEYVLALVGSKDEQFSTKKRLQDITCPVLVVTGDTDRIVPDWNSERLAKVFPRGEFMRIRKCGHLPHEEMPDEFLNAVKQWLARTMKEGFDSGTSAADLVVATT